MSTLTLWSTPVTASRSVRWVTVLVVASVVTQRFAVPGTVTPLLLPLVAGWLAAGLVKGVLEFDPWRSLLWALAAVATGGVLLLGAAVVDGPPPSLGSWALVLAVSATLTVRLVDRGLDDYRVLLHRVSTIGAVLATVCLVMTGTQLLGLSYSDLFAAVVPEPLRLTGYVITYPYTYDSPYYRANAWFGLEPSFVSFQLGLALLAAILVRRDVRVLALIGAGLVSTASGSGMYLALVGIVALLSWPRRHVLARYLPWALAALAVLLATPLGQSLAARIAEVGDSSSSASLRAVAPYSLLVPRWTVDLPTMLVGLGPGSSQDLVGSSGDVGLLVPTPMKIFFDYGLVAGAVLAAAVIAGYRKGPAATLAFTLFVSLWTVQPGLTTILLVVDVLAVVSLWAPREGPPLEALRGTAGREPDP